MLLDGKPESWANFFEVMKNLKHPIQRMDGQSTSNYWALIQHLEQQFRDAEKEVDIMTRRKALAILCDRLDEDLYLYVKRILHEHNISENWGFQKEKFKQLLEDTIMKINSLVDEPN